MKPEPPLIEEIQDYVHRLARILDEPPPDDLLEFGQGAGREETWYLIGLIGGKEVGKSALVNALAGREIAESTSHGPGTERVLAYVHRAQTESVRNFLENEVSTDFEIVEHQEDQLNRQVLLDLPDIDSHYSAHFETVRKLLRFILFPLWIQSVEKYADRQPMELLRKVVKGNAPENFFYCLNKADQLERSAGEEALGEITEDYRARIAQSLALDTSPSVYLISAHHPDRYDFPLMRKLLSKQKEEKEIQTSRILAVRQFGGSLLTWARNRNLPDRAERARRMEGQLSQHLHRRIEVPISETLLPSIREDERIESFLFSQTFQARIRRWPLVRLFDTISGPARRLLRLAPPSTSVGIKSLSKEVVDQGFAQVDPSIYQSLQACFAHCRGSFPEFADMYGEERLWEEREAKVSAGNLRGRLVHEVETLMENFLEKLKADGNPIGGFFRFFLIFGSLVWFPFGQPVLQHYLEEGELTDIPLLIVSLLGVSSLLSSALFLFFLFGFIWLSVRWRAQHSVQSALRSFWRKEKESDFGLEGAARDWGRSLLEPIEAEKEKMLELDAERARLERALATVA